MIRKLILGALAATAFPTIASAATFDAFSSFNGTQGAGNFYYGLADPANPGTSGTFFAANTNCFIDGATCLQAAPNHDVPGFTKGGSPAVQYGSVNVPQDRLLGHPANDDTDTFIAFVAPTAGRYHIDATFNIQDINPSGVRIDLIQTTSGLPLIFSTLATIDGSNTSYHYVGDFDLGDSYAIGFGLNRDGVYYNDSTGVNFTASVPETATWAMMIGGMGLIGGALRRRKPSISVRYA